MKTEDAVVDGKLQNELLGQFYRKANEIVRRMNEGTLEPQWVLNELQRMVEGRVGEIRQWNDKPAGNAFSITCEGVKASELVKRGKYDWVNHLITDKLFPIKSHSPQSRTLELVQFDRDVTSDEVFAEFARRGLKRPTYEDALVFGITYPEEQRKHPVFFLHEPVGVDGHRDVLVLSEGAGGRGLFLFWFGSRWGRSDVFAGLRK